MHVSVELLWRKGERNEAEKEPIQAMWQLKSFTAAN